MNVTDDWSSMMARPTTDLFVSGCVRRTGQVLLYVRHLLVRRAVTDILFWVLAVADLRRLIGLHPRFAWWLHLQLSLIHI